MTAKVEKEYRRYKAIQDYEPSDDAVAIFCMDFLAILFLIAGFVLDYFFGDVINQTILALSIDTLLTLVTVVIALVVPITDNQSLKNSYVNPSDYKVVKGKSNGIFVNLLVIALALFLINVFLYVFDFRLSLLVTFCISFAFIAVFAIPSIYERIKGEDIINKLIVKKFNYYKDFLLLRKKDETNIYSETTGKEMNSLNKLIEATLLKNGFRDTINLLTASVSSKSEEYIDIYFYLNERLMCLSEDLKKGYFSFPITTSVIDTFLNNLNQSLFRSHIPEHLKDNDLNTFLKYASNSIINISILIDSDSKYKSQKDVLTNLVKSLVSSANYEKDSTFYLTLCFYLLIYTIDSKQSWFIKDVSRTIKIRSGTPRNPSYFASLTTIFLTIVCQEENGDKTFTEEIKHILSDYYSKPFGETLYPLVGKYDHNLTCFLNKSLYQSLSYCNKFIGISDGSVDKRGQLINDLEMAVSNLPIVLMVCYYCNCPDTIDNFLDECGHTFKEMIDDSLKSKSDILDFFRIFFEINPDFKNLNDINVMNTLSYIEGYKDRLKELDKLAIKIRLQDFCNKLENNLSVFDWYIDKAPKQKGANYEATNGLTNYIVYIGKDESLFDDNNFLNVNLNSIASLIFNSAPCRYHYPFKRIDRYNVEIQNEIYRFNPTCMDAPSFIKFCKENQSPISTKLLCIAQSDSHFPLNGYCETFFKKNAFKIFVKPLTEKAKIKNITKEEATKSLYFYDDLSSISDNVLDGDAINEFVKTHIKIIVPLEYCIYCDYSKILIYGLPYQRVDCVKPSSL